MAQVTGGSSVPARYQKLRGLAVAPDGRAPIGRQPCVGRQVLHRGILEQIIRIFEQGRFLQRGYYAG